MATEAMGPAKPKILMSGPLQKNLQRKTLLQRIRRNNINKMVNTEPGI